jgi:hypothetical protein
VAETKRLLNARSPKGYREFESRLLRHSSRLIEMFGKILKAN